MVPSTLLVGGDPYTPKPLAEKLYNFVTGASDGGATIATRVLIVEDDLALRAGLQDLLACEGGIDVMSTMENGEEALRQIIALKPDIVVLDYSLPDMSGAAVAAETKARDLPTQVLS